MTGVSVAAALVVGTIELFSIAAERLPLLQGRMAAAIDTLDLSVRGYAVVGLFAVTWMGSMAAGRMGWLNGPLPRGVAGPQDGLQC